MTTRYSAKDKRDLSVALIKAIQEPAEGILQKVALEFCNRQAALDPNGIMQFRYADMLFKYPDDPVQRLAKVLHPSLQPEFEPHYQYYVEDMHKLLASVRYLLSDTTRLATCHEDLYALLPEAFHDTLNNLSYGTDYTRSLLPQDLEQHRQKYKELFDEINVRIFLGVVNE